MSDFSSNENGISDSVSDNDNTNVSVNSVSDNEEEVNEEESQSTVITYDPIDYTGYFENLQTIGIFISALLVAYGLAFAFFKSFIR